MPLFDKIHSHRQEILAYAHAHGLKDIRIFGSVARREEKADSDVDLLVNVEEDCDPFGFLKFREQLSQLLERKIDIVFEQGLHHLLRARILAEGTNTMSDRDIIYLKHIRECIHEISLFTCGMEDSFHENSVVWNATLRMLQIMAESTTKLSNTSRKMMPKLDEAAQKALHNLSAKN